MELITSPTEDQSKLLASLAKIKIFGKSDFVSSVQIAQLSLKYRKNVNGGKRIIVFVGSPLSESIIEIEKIAKSLKKNAIAVDVISIGELEQNQEKLTTFVNAVNAEDNSHLINVPSGVLPSDALISSPILMTQHGFGRGASGNSAFGGDGNFEEFDVVDPSLDPDVAMAIRASLEEAREREEARASTQVGVSNNSDGQQDANVGQEQAEDVHSPAISTVHDTEDEDALLQSALEMSLKDSTATVGDENTADHAARLHSASQKSQAIHGDNEDDIALKQALAMSVEDNPAPTTHQRNKHHGGHHHKHHQHHHNHNEESNNDSIPIGSETETSDHAFLDPAFISELLGSVDVDQNDPMVQAALVQMGIEKGEKENAKETDKDSPENKKRKGDDETKK